VGAPRASAFAEKRQALTDARVLLTSLALTPNELAKRGLKINQDGVRRTAFDLAAYPDVGLTGVVKVWPELSQLDPAILEQVGIDAQYAGYLDRQAADIKAFRRDEELRIPVDLDYTQVYGISAEIRQKLMDARPVTLGQAGRIEGMTPAALTALLIHVKRPEKRRVAGE
jgi:tRNA uridine 5-carboxymethylaminomethyl modification enzyme